MTVTDINEAPDIDEDTVADYAEIEYDFTGTPGNVHTFTAEDYDDGDTIEWSLVIANARRHREEQRTRADLEALTDTSPVDRVAVFDAGSGALVSFNRETARILEALRTPDHPVEQLLEVLTLRRADGREVSLQELTLAQALSAGETVRSDRRSSSRSPTAAA